MITYKDYQNKVLKSVDNYLRELHKFKKPNLAFTEYFDIYGSTDHGIKSDDVLQYKPYITNKNVPFNCIKVPTGGGKTLLACETINKSFSQLLNRAEGLVIWFVPTEAIYSQTLEKLKDPNDPHRHVLQNHFKDLNIFSKDEALKNLRKRHISNGSLTIIITIDKSFTNGTKVLEDGNDGYEEFNDIIENNQDLLIINTSFEGKDQPVGKTSLFNIIRILNPLILIDEGHLFGSGLITSTIADLNPSIIWEFSATPFKNSNIIHRTSPIELKREDMIKLPIQIRHELSWEDVLEKAIKLQGMLEDKAKEEEKISGRYVRPIVIIRPEQIKDDENKITPSTIKEYIAKHHPELKTKDEVEKDDKFQIAEKYTLGDTDKTKGGATSSKKVDTLGSSTQLYKPESEVRYIIAYKAIREGWDCSFAYVYANLSNIRSETDAEQFIGRILRMPNAKRLNVPELNKAYVITKGNENSQSDMEVSIGNIVDILIKNGFSKEEAEHVAKPISFSNSTAIPNIIGSAENSTSDQGEIGELKLEGNLGSKIDEYPYISTKQIDIDSFTLPKLYNDAKELREAHFLVGFNLDNLVLKTELSLINETTGVIEIDFNENENWQHSFLEQEQSIGLFGVTIEDLAEFIVRRSKDRYFDKPTEYKTVKKWLESITNTSVSELRRNLVTLSSYYLEKKTKQKDLYKKLQFEELVTNGNIKANNSFVVNLPEEQEVYNPAGNYQKSIYTLIDNLNNLEKNYIHKLNNDPTVEWLYRNRERQDYYIQGWWGRFYPDFIYQTNDGILHIAETKGREDDTDKEKKKLGELLEQLYPEVKFEWIKE